MALLTLDNRGVLLAFVFGVALWFLGLKLGYFMVLESIVFIIIAALVTDTGKSVKKSLGTYQRDRGIENVIANGMGPLIMAVGFYISSVYLSGNLLPLLFLVGFIGSVAAVTADKFGSEVGVFGGTPVMILTGKPVKVGTSGGVTALGIVAGLLAAFLMVIPAVTITGYVNSAMPGTMVVGFLIAAVIVGGFFGNLADSVLGYYEEKKIGNKYTSNFISSVIGGAIAIGVFLVLLAL
ncbi:MAG: DUF92 domain-containing protein [Candidatus Micrarchaeota archaeon]|nr:DUF92 domain-containing protein [Candidatus Micrarchaeota archaeon]